MDEKNSSGWYLHQVEQFSRRRLTPIRVLSCSRPFEVGILVEQHDPDAIRLTERLFSIVADAGIRVRLVSRQDYDRDVRIIRDAIALG